MEGICCHISQADDDIHMQTNNKSSQIKECEWNGMEIWNGVSHYLEKVQ